jgi:uncharacterized protein YndB with AHSA1/START domain
MKSQGSARAVADLMEGTIHATVEIAAPPERVFRALVDGADVVRWWGSDTTYRTTAWTSDVRVGGTWRAEGRSVGGDAFAVGGTFLEVDPPRKLVQTWIPSWMEGEGTTLTYRLDAIEGGTRLTLRHDGFAARPAACRSHTAGWEMVLGWLEGFLAPPVEAPEPTYFMIRLLPPRPSFAQDLNAEEAALMKAHGGYWRQHMAKGKVPVVGPVMTPEGAWGLGVLQAESEAEARAFMDGDPTIASGRGFRYEVFPMLQAIVP